MSSTANASLNHQCSLCQKIFHDSKALTAHIGTTNPLSASAHPCTLCKRQFCSTAALQKHQEASHNTTFRCNECAKAFRSQDALKSHQRAKKHGNSEPTPGNSEPPENSNPPPRKSKPPPRKQKQPRQQRRSWDGGMGAPVGWKFSPITGQMMNMSLGENWALCDKDCAWCGHCADNIDFDAL